MYLMDLSFNALKINPPNAINENHYVFPISYNNETPILFSSKQSYILHIKEKICELHIKDRTDLTFFNDLYKYLLELLYQTHDEWFETSFERNKYVSMFKEYLYPNIQENAVNIKCNVNASILETLSDSSSAVEVYPTFQLNSIVFDNLNFQIDLELRNIQIVPQIQKETMDKEESVEEPDENEKEEEEESTNENKVLNSFDLAEEVDVQPTETLDESDININDEDYYILFKIIHSAIKDNFANSILSVLQEKNINTETVDIQNIAYDSDDYEDSEDEYLDNDQFEENFKNI